jgi:hypothetical protein
MLLNIFRVVRVLTLKVGQTSDPKTLVIHQKMTPGNNPEDVKQHYDQEEAFNCTQLHVSNFFKSAPP